MSTLLRSRYYLLVILLTQYEIEFFSDGLEILTMKFSKWGQFEIFRGLNCYIVAFLHSEDLIRYGKLVLNLDAIIYKGKIDKKDHSGP